MAADVVRAHLRHGELTLAVAAARNALGAPDQDEEAELWALLARALCRIGEPREAARATAEARKAAERSPPTGLVGPWELALAQGEALLAQGQPFAARAVFTDAIAVLRSHHPGLLAVDGPIEDVLRSVSEAEVWLGIALAEACRAAGHAEDGMAAATRALVNAERTFGREAVETADALLALGGCRHAAGLEDASRTDLMRCLKIRRGKQAGHPDLAATLDLLGTVERNLGRPADAVKRHREALAIWIARTGEHSGPVGSCRHSLAQALHRTGDFEGARTEMADALRITTRAFGADHVDAHIARFELGRFEMDCGLIEEGLGRMEAARKATVAVLGDGHPVIKAMNRWL